MPADMDGLGTKNLRAARGHGVSIMVHMALSPHHDSQHIPAEEVERRDQRAAHHLGRLLVRQDCDQELADRDAGQALAQVAHASGTVSTGEVSEEGRGRQRRVRGKEDLPATWPPGSTPRKCQSRS